VLLDRRPRPWAELVFHVLAHVRGTSSLAASVFDPRYVRWAESALGPARDRTLATDAAALAQLAPSHESLARTQVLAWLFTSLERASAVAVRPLEELEAQEVDAPELLAALLTSAAPVELLRCAAELEREAHARLPAIDVDFVGVERELSRVSSAAPGLSSTRIALVSSLGRRGRVMRGEIWVGAPCAELEVTASHVAWQAAHEATVREVADALRISDQRGSERGVEQAAVVVLAERSRSGGLAAEHETWLAHFGANRPETDRRGLTGLWGPLVSELLDR